MTISVEIMAYHKDFTQLRNILLALHAKELGIDHQIDTYFHSKHENLKLREGNKSSQLLHYKIERGKQSVKTILNTFESNTNSSLKQILEKTNGSNSIVDKTRESYCLDNIYFHIDKVKGLGDFIKIEASDLNGSIELDQLKVQCKQYLKTLEINANNILTMGYKELLEQNKLFNQILVDE